MLSINEIKKPIAADIDVFEGKFKASMQSSVPLLDRITHYIVKRKGKQIRPMFVFFSASICGGINESTHRGAALVELLHTATLIHDDVVVQSTPVFAGFAMTVMSALFLLPLMFRGQGRIETLVEYRGEFALLGFREITFMVSKLTAMQILAAPQVVAIQRLSLLLAIIAGRVFFKEPDFGRRMAAGMLILAGVLLVALAQR